MIKLARGSRATKRRFAPKPKFVLPVFFAVMATAAFGVADATASGTITSCTGDPNGSAIPTGIAQYDVENSGSVGASACVTVNQTPGADNFVVSNTAYTGPAASQFIGYKAIYTGCKHAVCLEPGYPAVASTVTSEPTSWSFNFSSPGKFDAVYDSFFDQASAPSPACAAVGNPDGAELMIWLNWQNVSVENSTPLTPVTIAGTTYQVYPATKTDGGCTWNRIVFLRSTPTTSVSNLNVAPFIQAAISDGLIAPTWYQQFLEAGNEIWSGGNGIGTTSFSAPAPTIAASASGGTGGTGGGGAGSGATVPATTNPGGSGAGGAGSGASAKKKDRGPSVSVGLPVCSVTWSKKKCAAYRRTAGAWRYIYGYASGSEKVKKVMVTAHRVGQKDAKGYTIKVHAKFNTATAWKGHLGTLTKGKWRFSAMAADSKGKQRISKAVVEHINVGLPATALPKPKHKKR